MGSGTGACTEFYGHCEAVDARVEQGLEWCWWGGRPTVLLLVRTGIARAAMPNLTAPNLALFAPCERPLPPPDVNPPPPVPLCVHLLGHRAGEGEPGGQ